jgi:signal transduction histidine kinase
VLRRSPSLALRAALIFISIYVLTVLAFLTLIASTNSDGGDNHHQGAVIALSFAADELQLADDGFRLPTNGRFAELAARNPAIWLIGRSDGRYISLGEPPEYARRLCRQYEAVLSSASFVVAGHERALADATVERRVIGGESVLLAAGGVDAATLSIGDSLHMFRTENVWVLLVWIAGVGFVAMLVALPLLTQAVRPIMAEASSINPQDPGHRLNERTAPRELLPLVRVFNAALDRLGAELGRRKRFVADVAHELRTPLAVLALRVDALSDEDAKQDLRRAVARLSRLVEDMLDLERLSLSGRKRVQIDLTVLTRDVIADLAPMTMNSGYDLSLEAPDAPVTVIGDPHAIARAVTNLVRNAVAHGGGAGQIRVIVDECASVEVVDEGPGVSAAVQARLFEPFFRGASSSTGNGLGLVLTREIMRAHGGDVRLLPTEQGARFRLEFPRPAAVPALP